MHYIKALQALAWSRTCSEITNFTFRAPMTLKLYKHILPRRATLKLFTRLASAASSVYKASERSELCENPSKRRS
eukprot:1058870-Pelagomonas_calceolata.AAC.1